MNNSDIEKIIEERFKKLIKEYGRNTGFTERKVTDNPTDALSVVNRRYVTANGVTGSRPPAPITGQFYYDTTIDRPIWWNGSNWKNAAGATV